MWPRSSCKPTEVRRPTNCTSFNTESRKPDRLRLLWERERRREGEGEGERKMVKALTQVGMREAC